VGFFFVGCCVNLFVHRLLLLLFIFSISLADTKTVAISYFDNTSGKEVYNPLSKGLADMLITDLSIVRSLRIVEREKLESLLKEIDLGEGKFIDPNTAQKLGKGLGAGYMLTGSFLIMGETMRIDARLVDVGTGEISMAEEMTGEKNTFFDLEKKLVDKLIISLNLDVTRSELRKLKKVQTESFESFSAYSLGIDAFDKGKYDEAMGLLEKAVELDDSFDIAWDKLDELEKNLKDFMKIRALGLSTEIISEIDRLEDGDKSYCDSYNSKNWQLWGNLSAAGGLGAAFIDEQFSFYLDQDESIWQKHGYTKKMKSYEEFCMEYGEMLNHAFGSVEYVLSKNIPDDPCGVLSPNESALAMISYLLNDMHRWFGNSNDPPDVLANDGEIRINGDQYDRLLIKYGSDFIRRFPYSFYVSQIEPMIQAAIDREKRRSDS